MRECSAAGCHDKHYANGLCNRHFQRMKRTGRLGLRSEQEKAASREAALEKRKTRLLMDGLDMVGRAKAGRRDWMDFAACGDDPDFYDRPTSSATKVCKKCPVQAECLAYGLSDEYGVYGGMNETVRADLRAMLRAA